mmetsp:Transcript_9066/g.15314  ORF Transcript_9066/g.15314 Transcript_9066/m.15314 type:complete len:211 (-) Transcript_9066:676-1308(-)
MLGIEKLCLRLSGSERVLVILLELVSLDEGESLLLQALEYLDLADDVDSLLLCLLEHGHDLVQLEHHHGAPLLDLVYLAIQLLVLQQLASRLLLVLRLDAVDLVLVGEDVVDPAVELGLGSGVVQFRHVQRFLLRANLLLQLNDGVLVPADLLLGRLVLPLPPRLAQLVELLDLRVVQLDFAVLAYAGAHHALLPLDLGVVDRLVRHAVG